MSFIMPGFIIGVVGLVMLLFVVKSPSLVGINIDTRRTTTQTDVESTNFDEDSNLISDDAKALLPEQVNHSLRSLRSSSVNSIDSDINVRVTNDRSLVNEHSPMLKSTRRHEDEPEPGIGFVGVLKIPGVISEVYQPYLTLVIELVGRIGSDYTGMSAATCTILL